jgi:hypothetical protein
LELIALLKLRALLMDSFLDDAKAFVIIVNRIALLPKIDRAFV